MTRKTKGQWASLPSRLCFLLMPHHQGFASPILFDPVWSSYLCPLFMHYVKKLRLLSLFFPPVTIYCPPPSTPIYLSLTSPSPPFYFFSSLYPVLYPAFTHFTLLELVCVCVWICLRSVFFVDWLPAWTVKALPAARTWKMHRISLW